MFLLRCSYCGVPTAVFLLRCSYCGVPLLLPSLLPFLPYCRSFPTAFRVFFHFLTIFFTTFFTTFVRFFQGSFAVSQGTRQLGFEVKIGLISSTFRKNGSQKRAVPKKGQLPRKRLPRETMDIKNDGQKKGKKTISNDRYESCCVQEINIT